MFFKIEEKEKVYNYFKKKEILECFNHFEKYLPNALHLDNFNIRTYVSSQGQGAARPNDNRVVFVEEQIYDSDCYCFSSIGGDPC